MMKVCGGESMDCSKIGNLILSLRKRINAETIGRKDGNN